MLTQVDESGAIRTITQLFQVDTDGSVRQLKQLWQNDESNTPRLIFSSSAGVTASPDSASGYGNSRGSIRITVGPVSVDNPPSGSTFAWAVDGAGWQAINPTSQQTQFRSPSLGQSATSSTVARCLVTYPGGHATTNDVSLDAENVGFE